MFPTAYKPAAVPQDYQGFSVADNQIKNNKIFLLLLFCSKLIMCGYMIIIFTEIVIKQL